ncbi:MAG: glucose-1-phosphate adenylyltransferase subunit GlgD [Clostridiales bacterium]|nr:glucose-1-phosphate adenylyltransferase subunit GlgD [Candidatus Cacconaster stercorequi]
MNEMHGIIFSYEKDNELRELTTQRIHGSLPFGGNYRVVDFMLSNMVNAGIQDVGVIMHGKCQSMLDHLGTGKTWDLSRNRGGLRLLPAFAYTESRGGDGRFRGKVEALGCVMDYLKEIRQDYVVLSDSDLIINLPLEDVLHEHLRSGADLTAVCTSRPGRTDEIYFRTDADGRIVDTAYRVEKPEGLRGLNLYILRTDLLIRLVSECVAHNRYSFRHHILQDGGLHLHAYVWEGYAQRIDSVRSYYEHSMDLLQPEVRRQLFDAARPILGRDRGGPSSYVDPSGECVNSLVADSCSIQGSVRNSIIFGRVSVEPGAVVENCVLFDGTVIRSGASVRHVICDKNAVINGDQTLMGSPVYPMVIAKNSVV